MGVVSMDSGATNFSEAATMELLKIVQKYLPIGGASWEAVTDEYNTFAQRSNLLKRDKTSLRQKYDRVSKWCCRA